MFGKKTPAPLDGRDTLLLDLDGVVYRGPDPIDHAVTSIQKAAKKARIAYLTNNAARTDASVAEHLSSFGLTVAAEDVVTSPQAALRVLGTLVEPGALVMVVGGEGITVELEKAGYRVTRSADDNPDAVVQGFAPHVGWEHLAEAAYALQHDHVHWVATNTDWTIPQKRGIAPGNGTLVSAVHLAVGRLPVFAGKPEKPIYDEALERYGATNPLAIGDRLDTDIAGANRAGITSALVLTGIDQAKQILAASPEQRPTYILNDLRGLFEPYPEVITEDDADGVRTVTCGKAVVRMKQHVVRVARAGNDPLDLLRAGAAIIWASGLQIWGIDVDPQLYS